MANHRKAEHNYEDYSGVPDEKNTDEGTKAHSSERNFPVKLHFILSELEADGLGHIVSWQPHVRCCVVHKQDDFVRMVLPM